MPDVLNLGGGSAADVELMKDPITQKDIEVPKALKDFLGHVISTTRSLAQEKAKETYQPLIDSLGQVKTENAELAKALQEFKDSQMTDGDKKKRQAEETANKIKTLEGDVGKWRNKCFEMQKKDDVRSVLGDMTLHNPEEVVQLFLNDGNAKVEEILDSAGRGTDAYKTFLKLKFQKDGGGVEELIGTPQDLFGRWISQPQRQHHIKNNLLPGGGSHLSGTISGKMMNEVEFNSLNAKDRANFMNNGGQIK